MSKNLKNIIREEIKDFDWVESTNYDDTLDAYFGITTEPYYVDGILKNRVKVTQFDKPPYGTYKKIEKVSLSDLYKILTDISKNKSLFTKDYWVVRNELKKWKESRLWGTMLSNEVQNILRSAREYKIY